ncbi:MAG TPA: GNAT family N-acetyltransferase, partial [Spirochaetota bacterium]|nr:GNAT family N-acetyltransferase [Spirochaetota bacterium]
LIDEAKGAGLLYPDQIYVTASAVNYPPQYETRRSFKDGLELFIRPIRPSDEEMMRRLFYTFSDESKYLRYFTNIRTMPHKNMQKYVNIDYRNALALVAILQRGNAERIVAEARFAAYPGSNEFDMAFLVDEEFQGKGIASFMLEYIIRIAKERGVTLLTADVLPQNKKMLGVFERASLKPVLRPEDGSVKVEFHLA